MRAPETPEAGGLEHARAGLNSSLIGCAASVCSWAKPSIAWWTPLPCRWQSRRIFQVPMRAKVCSTRARSSDGSSWTAPPRCGPVSAPCAVPDQHRVSAEAAPGPPTGLLRVGLEQGRGSVGLCGNRGGAHGAGLLRCAAGPAQAVSRIGERRWPMRVAAMPTKARKSSARLNERSRRTKRSHGAVREHVSVSCLGGRSSAATSKGAARWGHRRYSSCGLVGASSGGGTTSTVGRGDRARKRSRRMLLRRSGHARQPSVAHGSAGPSGTDFRTYEARPHG